ncbi:polyprenyl synthetase family protein [Bifidobacterium imperatoris]|uniref:Polyprenyl synthetase family protein n=1 Tax=Bifidobacterium imperatoris TaxID=2020965 RepID=A0A2N5IVF4_9BIFI|nr:polyprenyl synthetase family protein [Bifidobacterium imperatoris]PLS25928.1 serralysin [Bifidobacterium imperatoris]QSY57603.1 polyprenyl synthetase family protein [Bifidobacterium imperatoris]
MCTTMNDLTIIEPRICELVRELTDAPATGGVADALRPVMSEVIDQAVASSQGGKRLRALLSLDAFDALTASHHDTGSSAHTAMLDLACAIEVFQTAALVHDDIIDESDLRRGKPSAHRALEHTVHNASIGRGLGLMLGDILATACIEIARRAARHLNNGDAIIESFLTMQREVEIGQVLDLGVEMTPLSDPQALAAASLNVFRWKTASYTTIAPLLFALLAAGVEPAKAQQQALAVGEPLGLAFQLADDLLDVIGSSRNTGKPVGGDIREGKRTVLLADALSAADASDQQELRDMFEAAHRDEQQVKRAIELFGKTGAIDRSRERISTLWKQSQTAITDLELNESLDESGKRRLTEACARFIPIDLR